MKRILRVALRDFLATVATKGFIIGLFITPAIGVAVALLAPRLFNDNTYRIEGEYAVIDPTGAVFPEMAAALDPETVARRRRDEFRRSLDDAPRMLQNMAETALRESIDEALGPAPNVGLSALPADTDVEDGEGLAQRSDRRTAPRGPHRDSRRRGGGGRRGW